MRKTVVLLSGGLDSTVNLYAAAKDGQVFAALTFDYGQRAASQEIRSAKASSQLLNIPHHVIALPWLGSITKTSLVNREEAVPTQVAIDDLSVTQETAKRVWVPNRNGVFLNIGAAFAESLGAELVIAGFNREEATTFPDNSEDFLDATTAAFEYSTANHVGAYCYTVEMDKREIVRKGRELDVNFDLVWSCYFGGETACGQCESCLRFKRALER